MEPKLVRFADVKPVYAFPGIARRTLIWGDQAMLIQNCFTAGAGVPEHAHPQEQVSYVLEGSLVVEMQGVTYVLNAGDSLVMPSNVAHSARSPEGGVVIEVFAPPREDFK